MMEAVRILILLVVVLFAAYLKHSAQTAVMPVKEVDQEVEESQHRFSMNESFFIRKALCTVASIGERDLYSISIPVDPGNDSMTMDGYCME